MKIFYLFGGEKNVGIEENEKKKRNTITKSIGDRKIRCECELIKKRNMTRPENSLICCWLRSNYFSFIVFNIKIQAAIAL